MSRLARRRGRTFASLRKHRNYRLYFWGQVTSTTGSWMQDTALPWLVFRMTHSAIDVGILIFCRYAPFAAFGLFAGALADRFDNRRVMIVTQSSAMSVAVALGLLVAWTTEPPLWAIYVLATFGGAAVIFDAPSRHALTYRLVGRSELPNAVALNSSVFNAGRVVGPATAGVVIGTLGIGACFWLNAATFLVMLAALLAMRTGDLFSLDRDESSGRRTIREGLRYVWREPRTRLLLTVACIVGFTGFNFRTLLPVLAGHTLEGGAGTFGLLWSAFGIGALAGALYAAGTMASTWRRFVCGTGGFGISLLVLAPLGSTAAACAVLVAVGFTFTLWTASSQSILQLTAPDHLRGRVLSIYLFGVTAFVPLGGLFAAWLVVIGGTELAFAFAGTCAIAVTAFAVSRLRPGEIRGLASRRVASMLSSARVR